MGKVNATFGPGWPGSVSRSIDDIIVALPSRESEREIAFGAPVWLTGDGTGVRGWTSGDTAEHFAGFAVRSPSKTPDRYPRGAGTDEGSRAAWLPGEPVDVLVRGCIVVDAAGSARQGAQAYLDASGRVTASAGSNPGNLALPGCRFRRDSGAGGRAELLITSRNNV